MSHWWCCCGGCPLCTVQTRHPICCPCVPLALCVTFTPTAWDAYEAENLAACETDTQTCRPTSVEIDWDEYEQAYIGEIAGHDLYYSFYRNEYDGKCYFYLQSDSLGRHEWEIKETADQCYGREEECITCLELDTAVGVEADPYNECAEGTITTTPVVWITPTSCSTCLCLCECLCVFVTLDGISYSGKACWDDYEQAYVGDVSGEDAYGVCHTRSVRVPIDRWGDVCDPEAEESDPTACEPVQVIDDSDYEPDCVITGTWTMDDRHGYRGEIRWAAAGSGDNTIEWRFTDLLPGRWKVSATWVPGDGRASDAPYTILAGTRVLETVPVNQANLPDDFTYNGSGWELLGTYRITNGELTVRLTDDADGDVIADAIHLEYIDDRCAIGFEISADEGETGEVDGWIRADWQLMTDPCELRSVTYSWHIERDLYDDADDIEVSVRCATCNEECQIESTCDCDGTTLPATLTATFHSTTGRASGLEGCTITLNWFENPGGDFGNPGGCFESDLTQCCEVNWVLRLCCQSPFFPATLEVIQGCWTSGSTVGFGKVSEAGATCNPLLARFGPFDIKCSDLVCDCGDNFVQDPSCVDGEFWIDVTE